MANGTAVRLPLVTFEPTSAKPAAAPAATAIQIGEAVASAVEAVGLALIDTESGTPLRAEIRTLNGEKIAVVVTLWLDHLGESDDFRGLAQREGRRVLLERHGEALRQQLGANVPEAVIARCVDELCGWITTIAGQVAAVEAVYRSN
jgi:hypothetical protein